MTSRSAFAIGLKVLLPIAAAGALSVVGFTLAAYRLEHRIHARSFPATRSTEDTSAVSRGEYLVHGPGHCADCHASPAGKAVVERGGIAPLSGGHHLDIFLGRITFPNITPDSATGIGARSDGELARLFRHGLDARGGIGLPFMDYADLAESDLVAILSYLRSVRPVWNVVSPSRYNVLGKITRAYFLAPFDPQAPPPAAPIPGRTVEYGRYLVEAVAGCAACHTARNMKTGEYTGPRFGGGMVFRRAGASDEFAVSPNLTPEPATGVMAAWDESAFVRRFKAGQMREWSPMPWGPFSRVSVDDLAAMHLYLSGLAAVRQPTQQN